MKNYYRLKTRDGTYTELVELLESPSHFIKKPFTLDKAQIKVGEELECTSNSSRNHRTYRFKETFFVYEYEEIEEED